MKKLMSDEEFNALYEAFDEKAQSALFRSHSQTVGEIRNFIEFLIHARSS